MSVNSPPVASMPIPGFPAYRVAVDGSVWSCWQPIFLGRGGRKHILGNSWQKLATNRGRKGYYRVALCPGRKYRFVHQLVLEAFVGPCPPGMECLHGDGNPGNNRLDNLRWGTKSDNAADAIAHGAHPNNSGERHGMAKLTEADVRAIREEYATGKVSQRAIAIRYGVCQPHIGHIVRKAGWKSVA